MRLLGELPQIFFGEVRPNFVDIVEAELDVDLSSVEGVKLQGVSVDVPSVFDLVTVWHEILEVFALEINAFSKLGNIGNAFHLLADQVSEDVGSLFGIGPFCLGQADDLLLLYDQQIVRNLPDLARVEV